MSDAVASAREALVAQLLEDIDELAARLEAVDQDLGKRIEDAVRDATGQAFLRARLELEAVMEQQTGKLDTAGRHAGALIGQAIRQETAAITVGAVRRCGPWVSEALWSGLVRALIVGVMGCFGGAAGALVTLFAHRWMC